MSQLADVSIRSSVVVGMFLCVFVISCELGIALCVGSLCSEYKWKLGCKQTYHLVY